MSSITETLHKIKLKIKQTVREYLSHRFSKVLYLSLGENCLTDNILQRHGLKSFSTPYSHGRSNIDYAILLEKTNYKGFLKKGNLHYDFIGKNRVVRSKTIKTSDNIYCDLHMNGFECTHHDVINSDKERESLKRKIKRLLKFRGEKSIVFFYHHRINDNSNIELILRKAEEFAQFYNKKNHRCIIIVFTQKIINQPLERQVLYKAFNTNIHFFEFFTYDIWSGDDDAILWARVDEDLIKKMVDTTKTLVDAIKEVEDGIL